MSASQPLPPHTRGKHRMMAARERARAARCLIVSVCVSLFHLSWLHTPGPDAAAAAVSSGKVSGVFPVCACAPAIC